MGVVFARVDDGVAGVAVGSGFETVGETEGIIDWSGVGAGGQEEG